MSAKLNPVYQSFLRRWQRSLHLTRQTDRSWHLARLREERAELAEARSFIAKISEESDVVFAVLRASCDGHHIEDLKSVKTVREGTVHAYMVGKYRSRCLFYRTVGRICRFRTRGGGIGKGRRAVIEVVNPKKDKNLVTVAGRHGIDGEKFKRVGGWVRAVWPLLP